MIGALGKMLDDRQGLFNCPLCKKAVSLSAKCESRAAIGFYHMDVREWQDAGDI